MYTYIYSIDFLIDFGIDFLSILVLVGPPTWSQWGPREARKRPGSVFEIGPRSHFLASGTQQAPESEIDRFLIDF